jgi:hypothetical protein
LLLPEQGLEFSSSVVFQSDNPTSNPA